MSSIQKPKLPEIDFSIKNLNPGSSCWVAKCDEVTRALEDYGCFIAIYDGVSQQLHDGIFVASQQLFDLPTEVKMLNTSDTPSHGYVGQIPVVPLYESLGIENATTKAGVQLFTRLMWPSGNQSFCKSALMYSKAVAELDEIVMRMIAECYGIEEEDYESLRGSKTYLVKLIKYLSPESSERNQGIVPHVDKSFMSIIHQHEVKGLEILSKDGDWIEVDPLPSTFIVMAGDACMAWTNGKIKGSCHRVIMEGYKDRYSVGLFTFIRDVKIETAKELIDENHPLQFKPFDHYKYLHYHASTQGMKSKCPLKSYCGI